MIMNSHIQIAQVIEHMDMEEPFQAFYAEILIDVVNGLKLIDKPINQEEVLAAITDITDFLSQAVKADPECETTRRLMRLSEYNSDWFDKVISSLLPRIQESKMIEMYEFLEAIKGIVESCGFKFSEVTDSPDLKYQSLNMTFYSSDEELVDQLIRKSRTELLNDKDLGSLKEGPKFIFSIVKSYIRSHKYWSLKYYLSENYSLIENAQA